MLSNERHPLRNPGRAIYEDACTGAKAAILISILFTLRRIHPLPCDKNMKRIFNILLNILKKILFESPSKYTVVISELAKILIACSSLSFFCYFYVEIQRHNKLIFFGCNRNFAVCKVSYDVSIVQHELHEILVVLRSINREILKCSLKGRFCWSSACFTSSRGQSMLISYVRGKAISRIKASVAVETTLY